MTDISKTPIVLLLVEDNPAHAELVIRCFEENNIISDVRHVSDGEAALQYLHREGKFADPQTSPRPRVILLDLRLPKIDGLSIIEEIKSSQELNRIPVVILTTSKRPEDLNRAYTHHANSYLVKPIDFDKFSQLMHDLGYYWLNWNQGA